MKCIYLKTSPDLDTSHCEFFLLLVFLSSVLVPAVPHVDVGMRTCVSDVLWRVRQTFLPRLLLSVHLSLILQCRQTLVHLSLTGHQDWTSGRGQKNSYTFVFYTQYLVIFSFFFYTHRLWILSIFKWTVDGSSHVWCLLTFQCHHSVLRNSTATLRWC